MPTLHYRVVDVFTDTPFTGNPLAVVLDADDLPAAAMQALAREFNLSETAFPVQASEVERAAGADYRLRIFTPLAELPFAGHPSVGAAWVLGRLGRVEPGAVRQACGAGVLPLTVAPCGGPVELAGGAPRAAGELDPAALLRACGLAPADRADHPTLAAGAGLDFGYLPLTGPDAVRRAAPDLVGIGAVARAGATGGLSLFSWDAVTRTAHTRVFAGDLGVPEDPATGSAALGLGAYLVATGLLPGDAETAYTVVQGVEMGRPSRLDCTVVAAGGRAVGCRVAGHVVPVASGEITRPVVPAT